MRHLIFAAALLFCGQVCAGPELEKKFDALIQPNDLRGWMRQMASEPNHVGSAHDKANAEFQLAQFKSWGWDAHIETFEVLYPTPVTETLDLVAPTVFHATLQEPAVAEDKSTMRLADALPAYVAYQGDGDVQANLVYVNYGSADDYEMLDRLGVSVKGKIVIARYGKGWRGLKPKLAQEQGAIGCLIYSDPINDGYGIDDTYPKGPMRPPQGIQRGSVSDTTRHQGDPSMGDDAPIPGAKHLSKENSPTIVTIPVLPISYGDAQVFLAALGGPVAPKDWRGGLPITYHVGPGPAEVHLAVKSDWRLRPLYDVIATLKGSEFPDQWVLRGNHHDGWVFGATDPLSGQVALMAEAKAIGTLAKNGFKPKRTLVYANWDGEEGGMLGSTAWLQAHFDELRQKTVLYVNSDLNARGYFNAAGSAGFQHLINQVANDVIDPETQVSVSQRRRTKIRLDALASNSTPQQTAEARLVALPGHDIPLTPLGGGSDSSPFLHHLGVPVVELAYEGEGKYAGVYHSAYDTFEHHSTWVDPGFVYDALLAQTAGHVMLRVAEADLPPQRAGDFAEQIGIYLDEVKKLIEKKRSDSAARKDLLDGRAYRTDDPTRPLGPPPALAPVPFFDFSPIENAAVRLQTAATSYDSMLAAKGQALPPPAKAKLWATLQGIDQTLAPEKGLPGRAWFKNLIYAPGENSGYGASTLPGIREAVDNGRWGEIDSIVKITAGSLNDYSNRLEAAIAVMQ